MKHLPLLIFFAVSLLNLLGVATANDTLIYISKPLLMPALMVWLIVETNRHGEFTFRRRSVIGALVFSTLGDVLLMFAGEIFFILDCFSFYWPMCSTSGAFAAIANHKNGFLARNSRLGHPVCGISGVTAVFPLERNPGRHENPGGGLRGRH
jgi:uncharacterized membrane protein YhhN